MPNGVAENPASAWNDFSTIASLEAGLSGIKTIGGTTPDYATFGDALTAMNTYGLCGAVIFDVRDGIYNEQLNIDAANIATDATNNVTFRSENGDASLVTLSFAGTAIANNFVVKLVGADYITFEDLTLENTGATYGQVVVVQGGAEMNTFERCYIHTIANNTTSTNSAVIYSPSGSLDNGNTFMDNIIEGGSYGAYWYGGGTTSLEAGTVFQGNTFMDNYYYGGRFDFQDAPMLVGNSFVGESVYTGSRFAMYINYCDNGFTATDNVISGSMLSGWTYGLYILNSDATSASHASIANNMVQVGKAGSTATMYGLYTSNDGYTDVYHNSVFVSEGGALSRAFYGTGGGANTLMNNMFVNYTAGFATYLASNYTVIASDNNLFHSPGGNVGYLDGNLLTLADWQSYVGSDANSVDTDPMFHSTYDLHVCNDSVKGLGAPLASVTMDIDGQPRNAATPDMGADEFTALSTDFLGADQALCAGDVLMLYAGSPTDAILWSTGDTTMMIDASMPGTYSVDIVSVCGTGADTIIVSASALVYTDFLVADELEFCAGDNVLLYHMLGEEVAVKQINALNGIHSGVIDLSTSAPGMYFLKIMSDNTAISTHVLVKK